MITVVVGASFGSEGKGAVVGHIAGGYQVHVRVGAANAGHTVYMNGQKKVVQQLPVAAYAHPFAKLVLGAGAMISEHVLYEEIQRNSDWRTLNDLPPLRGLLFIDHRAHVVSGIHMAREAESDLAKRIGSTSATAGEGIGEAQAARVLRTDYRTMGDGPVWSSPQYMEICDTVELLHDARILGTNILIEGTQGTGLDNVLGFYPYVTSRHVTASGILADCGFGPLDADHVLMVARTYPIRVAGNSGPFWPDSKEIAWADIGVDEQTEKTTVTKKVRRVATFSYEQIKYAARVNSATEIALNFADYLTPEIRGKSGAISAAEFGRYDFVGPMVQKIEELTQIPVCLVGTGPDTMLDRASPAQLSELCGA